MRVNRLLAVFWLGCAEAHAQEPLGACCDWVNTDENGEAVCREVPLSECPARPSREEPQWVEGASCQPDPFEWEPCGVAACCHFRVNPNNGDLDEVCMNLTRNECERQLQEPVAPIWQVGEICGLRAQRCPRYNCVRPDWCGKWTPCPHPYSCIPVSYTPNSNCCFDICSSGPEGAYCCDVAWDSLCCELVEKFCPPPPPGNDQCAPNSPTQGLAGALAIPVPGTATTDNTRATTSEIEPGFCCHNGVGICANDPDCWVDDCDFCTIDSDCEIGACFRLNPPEAAQGFGTMWFKFVQPAGLTTAGISTCTSNAPALDSLLEVFAVGDNSSPETACQSLYSIGCNDDSENCGSLGRNSRLCLRELTPGETYYIMLAAKTPDRLGQYRVTISTSCSGTTLPCKNCPVGEIAFINPPDGAVDARRPNNPFVPHEFEGIDTILVHGPEGAAVECWSACESPESPSALEIASVIESAPGHYTIELNQPIAAGAVTMVTYTDNESSKTIGQFVAHPGNVNADSMTGPTDILALIDAINGVGALPWGVYSGDLDHSGHIGPADIGTLIDLMNGVMGFDAWYGTPLPSADGCP